MNTEPGALDGAVQTLLAQHRAAAEWAADLAEELQGARARVAALADAVRSAATLLPDDDRTRVTESLAGRGHIPGQRENRAAATRQFLRHQTEAFTPDDLATWLTEAGHKNLDSRTASRLLHRAAERGLVERIERGLYRVVAP